MAGKAWALVEFEVRIFRFTEVSKTSCENKNYVLITDRFVTKKIDSPERQRISEALSHAGDVGRDVATLICF